MNMIGETPHKKSGVSPKQEAESWCGGLYGLVFGGEKVELRFLFCYSLRPYNQLKQTGYRRNLDERYCQSHFQIESPNP